MKKLFKSEEIYIQYTDNEFPFIDLGKDYSKERFTLYNCAEFTKKRHILFSLLGVCKINEETL